MATKSQKRKDKDRIVLKAGESQRPNGTYDYRWTGPDGKRHAVYAKTLDELREKESQIQNDSFSGLKAEARCVTVNEMFDLWCQIKRGLKDNTSVCSPQFWKETNLRSEKIRSKTFLQPFSR